jgi:IclR family acetate operon transcriptional repressor
VLPAHLSSGGKAALAVAGEQQLAAVLRPLDDAAAARLQRELRTVRRRGYAVNDQATEAGLTAVGVAVPPAGGVSGAAISVAAPTARSSRDLLPVWGSALTRAAAAIAGDLDTSGGSV